MIDRKAVEEMHFLPYDEYKQLVQMVDDDLYYVYDNTMMRYSMESEIKEEIFHFTACGIDPELVETFFVDGNRYEILAGNKYYVVSAEKIEKKELTIASVMFNDSEELQRAVADFNKTNREYYIRVVDYGENGTDYNDALTKYNLDIISGELPDIMVTSAPVDASVYQSKGILCDLYELMDDDPDFSRDMIVSSILKAYGEDHLYSIAPTFALDTIVGRDDLFDDYGLDFDEFRSIFVENGYDIGAINNLSSADEPALVRMEKLLMDDFIDWDHCNCSFECSEFVDLLEFVKDYDELKTYGNDGIKKQIQNGDIIATSVLLRSVSDYQLQKEFFGDDIVIIGYPTSKGSGTGIKFMGDQLSIIDQSPNKEAAWDFIKNYIMHPEYVEYSDFPIIKDLLNERLEKAKEGETLTDEFGQSYSNPKEVFFDTDDVIMVYEADDRDIEAVNLLIESADRRSEYHLEIQKIIDDESQVFFKGVKSADEVAKIIQSRVQLYLDENK